MSKNALQILGKLIHNLQKERGCVSLYSGSLGNKFTLETKAQFQKTDIIIQKFTKQHEIWKENDDFSIVTIEKLSAYLSAIIELQDKRKSIIELTISTSDIINYYTYEIISPLLDIMVKLALFDTKNSPKKVTAYTNFLYWKERTGRERAIGMRGFLSNSFDNKDFIQRISSLISEQESYKRTFLSLIDEQQKDYIEKILKKRSIMRVEKLHKLLESKPEAKSLSSMTPQGWYELMTSKIDVMYEIELSIIDTLSAEEQDKILESANDEACKISNRGIESLSAKQRDFIKILPFFSGVSESKISEILKNSQTKKYKKGNLLFLEGEQANRLYIVLNGWVKLFKGNIAGDETILQMLSSGNMIAESAIFLNSQHKVSAQIAEDATLLSIPAPIIRSQISNSTKLAVNMLADMSQNSQSLLHHIESTRLKSSNERVGWFLLKLQLDRKSLLNAIDLPYDKYMIASYLDMKPETFSRALKHFKTRDFKVENNSIILPDINALCEFCDIDAALMCSKHDTVKCPNPSL